MYWLLLVCSEMNYSSLSISFTPKSAQGTLTPPTRESPYFYGKETTEPPLWEKEFKDAERF